MDKFFCDLEEVLEKYNTDVTALDDYEVTAFHYTKFCKEIKTLPIANNFKDINHTTNTSVKVSKCCPTGGSRLCPLNNLLTLQPTQGKGAPSS